MPKKVKYTPPQVRPDYESAGYLGYYVRTYLPPVFDLIDLDGCWPAVWVYWKKKKKEARVFEEKPGSDCQELHRSQNRILRESTVFSDDVMRYVIWNADRLGKPEPEFPITITEIHKDPSQDRMLICQRKEFDDWLINED